MTRDDAIEALLNRALADKGVEEMPRGSNRGPRVEQMLRTCGLGGGYPWCAAAVAQWGVEALGSAWPVPRSADCDVLLAFARRKGVLDELPARGKVFLRLASQTDANHAGILSGPSSRAGYWWAWEGNTNTDGSREGYGVFFRERKIERLVFVDWAELLDTAPEPAPAHPSSVWSVRLSPWGPFPLIEEREGRPCAPVRAFVAALLKISLEATADIVLWDGAAKQALVAGALLPGTYLRSGSAWAPVREIAEALGCVVSAVSDSLEQPKRIVTVGIPKKIEEK